jgi:hypothetical protein
MQVRLLFQEDGGLTKEAAAAEIDDFVKAIQPREGFFYLHINAMGAGEWYGSNRNGDYFPESQLIKWHKTFETSPAHVFRHHVNKDPAIAIGKVIFSYYNPRMHRVELVAEVDKTKASAEYSRIMAGDFPMTSMACHTPFDVCSVCGNKATSRSMYCEHLNNHLNELLPDGRKVMSLNVGPLKFFDISIVIRPADVTSSVLQKVASDVSAIGSVEQAEMDGVQFEGRVKSASLKKIAVEKVADLIKHIDGEVAAGAENLDTILDRVVDPDMDIIPVLCQYSVEDLANAFAELGISPSLEFLATLLVSKGAGHEHSHLGVEAIKILLEMGPEALTQEHFILVPQVEEKEANPLLVKLLTKFIEGSSLAPSVVEKRAATYVMPPPTRPTGYTNFEPGRKPIEKPVIAAPVEQPSGLKLLLTVAGSALVLKYVINSLVQSKLEKAQSWLKSSVGNSFTKSASITAKLMNSSVEREFAKADRKRRG